MEMILWSMAGGILWFWHLAAVEYAREENYKIILFLAFLLWFFAVWAIIKAVV